MRLNLGCGDHYAQGWVNIDVHASRTVRPDLQCSAENLPYEDGSVAQVYAGHFLEHIRPEDMAAVLAEIRRVLAPDGAFLVVGPDADRARVGWPQMLPAIEGGEGRWPGDQHHWLSTEARTVEFLEAAGFTGRPLPVAEVDAAVWPIVSHVGWQLAVQATK